MSAVGSTPAGGAVEGVEGVEMFGRHIAGRSHDSAGPSLAGVAADFLGQAEIGNVGHIQGIEEDVGRFQVAMKNAVTMGVVHGLGNRQQVTGCLPPR